MKTLGLIGGISWVSTADYYRMINLGINEKRGGLEFARCLIYSFNYADIKRNNDSNNWESTFSMLSGACKTLKSGGAEAIILCANTMHLLADRLEAETGLPFIHIAAVTATEIKKTGLRKVGLLGTKFTMELDFFKSKLREQGIEAIIPEDDDRTFVHETIGDELGKGIIKATTKQRYLDIMNGLIASGAEGIIAGCTEIPLLVQQADLAVPYFDTTSIHASAAVKFALGEN